jgi:hypothetical protein
MDLARRFVRFLLSIQFGVVLIISLMFVMMFATQFEASTSTRAMKHFIYGSLWFDIGVYLFVINIVVNTLRRRPFKFRHTGFLTVHSAILIIVAGGLTTRYYGTDGTMPIPEGEANRAISLPNNDLVITAAGHTTRHETHYELRPWVEEHSDVYPVHGMPYSIQVDRYFPAGAVIDSLMNDAPDHSPIVQLSMATPESEPRFGFLALSDPSFESLSAGDVRVFLAEPDDVEGLQARWSHREHPEEEAPTAGALELFYADGGSEIIDVPTSLDSRIPTKREGIELEIVQVFRSFTVTKEGHADAVGKPENPAIHFLLHGSRGVETHFSFTKFPDFRAQPPDGADWLVERSTWTPGSRWTSDDGGREVAIVWDGTDSFRTFTSWNDPLDGVPLARAETRTFDQRSFFLRILDAAPHGRVSRVVVKTSDEILRPVVRVRLVEPVSSPVLFASVVNAIKGAPEVEPAPIRPNDAWVFHQDAFTFETPHGPLDVRYEGRSIPLDFAIHLDDFREEQYPGIGMAASYESHVRVQPDGGDEFPTEIKMNHPLKYAGFVFYQASFQRTPQGDEITVLSVARDPGMSVSFFGYCVLIAGLCLIFFVKPYFRKLDDRIARSRTVRAEGV